MWRFIDRTSSHSRNERECVTATVAIEIAAPDAKPRLRGRRQARLQLGEVVGKRFTGLPAASGASVLGAARTARTAQWVVAIQWL